MNNTILRDCIHLISQLLLLHIRNFKFPTIKNIGNYKVVSDESYYILLRSIHKEVIINTADESKHPCKSKHHTSRTVLPVRPFSSAFYIICKVCMHMYFRCSDDRHIIVRIFNAFGIPELLYIFSRLLELLNYCSNVMYSKDQRYITI